MLGIIKNRSYSAALANINKWFKVQDKNGVLHPELRSNYAKTGRRSCSSPNLQNINKGKTLLNIFPVPMRKCFKPKPGHILIPVDYAQIELRLIIDVAEEYEIISMLQKNPDTDLHHFTVECFSMRRIFEAVDDEIFKQGVNDALQLKINDKAQYKVMRSAYKNTGFSIAYGSGRDKVAQILNKQPNEIYVGDINYRKRFPKIDSLTKDCMIEATETGGVMTQFGRFLEVDPIKKYSAANYKIQGTAASVLKMGQNNCYKFIQDNKLEKWINIVLDIHDECIFSCDNNLSRSKEFDYIIKELAKCLEQIEGIKIPMKSEFSICIDNWHDKKGFETINEFLEYIKEMK